MKFAETLCKPGAYVEVVPAGLLVKLQYNQNGLLEKIYDLESELEITTQQFNNIKKFAPQTIPLNGGTTWVEGVFYTQNIPEIDGPLVSTEEINNYYFNQSNLIFYAANVKSLAAGFSGVRVIRNWLSSSGFNILPGMVTAMQFDETSIQNMVKFGNYRFEYPYIGGFYIFEDGECRFEPSNFEQIKVKKIVEEYSEYGYITYELIGESTNATVSAGDLVKYNIHEGSTILWIFTTGEVISCKSSAKEAVPSIIHCKWCGSPITINTAGPTECPDPHCLSHMYPYATKMLRGLDLPDISYEQYASAVNDKQITCITDVLLLANEEDIKPRVSLERALQAAIPADVCANETLIKKFVSLCNHSIDSVKYYINNPVRIHRELIDSGADYVQVSKLSTWLSDPYNSSTVLTVLATIDLGGSAASFDGAPIFRNNTFMITGKFRRGSQDDIASILKSYSAKVLTDTDTMVCDALVVGALSDETSVHIIQQAKLRSIPVMTEDEFFTRFDIDSDLASNLL